MDLNKKLSKFFYNGVYTILVIFILGLVALMLGYHVFAIVEIAIALFLLIFNMISKKRTEKRFIESIVVPSILTTP